MAIQTADEFLALLRKSKLLSAAELDDACPDNGQSDPKTVARSLVRQERLTRWQAGQLLAGRSSFFLGKYKLIDLLGHGGMGRVFLGEHTTMNRRVALKILPRRIGKDPAALERFLAEARNVAALDHPNIVQAYSVDNEGDRYYLVMEYVDGLDLEELVNEQGPPEFDVAADYIRQAAEGLAHGHDRGLVHCDIKPSNLLVNSQGVVKLVDMGLARAAGRDEEENGAADERVLGTIDYMAPEQGLDSTDFDHRADVYSLGCTFYFLLTGRPPFPGGTLPQRIVKHQTQTPPSVAKLRPGAPPELVAICERMMAKSPDDRYQSAKEISQALAPWRLPPGKASGGSGSGRLKVAEPLEAPDAGFPGINVGGSPAKAAAKTPPPVPAPSGEKVALLGTPARKLVVGGLALLLLVGIAAAATLPFLLGGDDSDETAAQANSQQGDNEPAESPGTKPEDIEEDLTLDDPEDGGTEQPGEEPPAGETDPAPPGDGGEEPTPPAGENPTDPPPDVEVPGEDPKEPGPGTEPGPGEEGGETPGTEPGSKPPDGSEKPEPDPGPKTPDPGPKKPDPPPKKPNPPPKKPDPFRELASAVELPVPSASAGSEAAGPVSLGRLNLQPDASCEIALLGGDEVLKGERKFAINGNGGGTWKILFADAASPGAEPQRTEVAQVDLDAQSRALQFRWLPGAGSVGSAYVRALGNCGLQLTVGKDSRLLPLGKPQHVEPLQVNLQTGTARQNLTAGNLPDPELLRIQVTKLEGEFPKHNLEPQDGIGGEEGVRVVFPSDGTVPTYGFHVKLGARGNTARLEAAAFVRLEQQQAGAHAAPAAAPARGPARPKAAQPSNEIPLNMRMLQQAAAAHVQTKMLIQQKYGDLNKLPRQLGKLKEQLQAQLDQADVGLGQVQILAERCQKIQQNGKIHYRIFAQLGEQQLDLIDTEQPGPAMEPAGPLGGDDGLDLDLDGDGNKGDSGGEKKTFF
jgi:hypothetical protein